MVQSYFCVLYIRVAAPSSPPFSLTWLPFLLLVQGSYIRGTNGNSNGIVPMLRVFNDTARYVDQGGGKRKGAFAIYLEPWHADIFDWLDLRKNHGKEEARCRDLFYGLWINDLFMQARA